MNNSTINNASTIKAQAINMDHWTDEELLLEYRKTNSESLFATLVKRYERELFNYLRRYLGNAAMAEDAFQMTFVQIHLKCDQFEEGRNFRPWLYTIATRQAIDLHRKNKRHKLTSLDRASFMQAEEQGSLVDLLSSEGDNPAEIFECNDRREWIRTAVEALPDQLQSAVKLVYFKGMKYREAADELSIPVGTVKSRLHSAVSRLGTSWTQTEPKNA